MQNLPNKNELLLFLKDKTNTPLFPEEIAMEMGLDTTLYRDVEKKLGELEQDGLVVRLKKGRYSIPEKVNMYLGNLRTTKQGYGFITPVAESMEEDFFIPTASMKNAIDGDLVLVKLINRSHKGLEGEIVRVVKRGRNNLVCEFIESSHTTFAAPINKRILVNILIPSDVRGEARDGDSVVVEITNWELGRHGMLEGKVVERLGPITDPRYDLAMILREFNISDEFSEAVMEEARNTLQEVDENNMEPDRKDLRSLTCFTIDGVDARDFDDAVSLEIDAGLYKLGVHIADVSYYVREDSALDKEAEKRTSSLYFSEAVIPMLPVQLSNGICSLNPQTPRRTISAFIWLNQAGTIIKSEVTRSMIISKARLNYQQIQRFFDGSPATEEDLSKEVADNLQNMHKLARILWDKRFQRGCLELDIPEIEIEVNDQGEPQDIYFRKRNWSDRIIEEFMILANETIANFCIKNSIPTLFRIHAEPALEKLEFFAEYLSAFGIKVNATLLSKSHELQKILQTVKDKPWEYAVNRLLLRSMMKAQYSLQNIGHFGLSSRAYLHFTSPIRRYPDLIVHRLLSHYLAEGFLSKKQKEHFLDRLPGYAQHCNKVEIIISEVERDYNSLKSAQFMSRFIGEKFKGIISGVRPFGFFVELERFPVEGLVKIHDLTNDYYRFDEDKLTLVGNRSKQVFSLGMEIEVVVKNVNVLDREIDLEPTGSSTITGKKSDKIPPRIAVESKKNSHEKNKSQGKKQDSFKKRKPKRKKRGK